MPHSFNKLWIHAIWATKERQPFIRSSIEKRLYDFIREQFIESECRIRIINGMPDHVHCLFLMNPKKSVADIMQQIKGTSSHYVNQNDLIPEKFSWQTGYAAYSVSESTAEKVFSYIRNQKKHHQKKSSQTEYDDFLKLYGFDPDPNG